MRTMACCCALLALVASASLSTAQSSDLWCWDRDSVSAGVRGDTITIRHHAAVYNCCQDHFDYTWSVQDNVIRVQEIEIGPACHCMCCFELSVSLGDVPPGSYQIDFSWSDYESGSEQHRILYVTVPPAGLILSGRLDAATDTIRVPPSPCLKEPPVSVADVGESRALALHPAQPNPAAPTTLVRYRLRESALIHLAVFSATGARVRLLAQGRADAGAHGVRWDGRNDAGQAVPAGVYFCRLVARHEVAQRTVILIR